MLCPNPLRSTEVHTEKLDDAKAWAKVKAPEGKRPRGRGRVSVFHKSLWLRLLLWEEFPGDQAADSSGEQSYLTPHALPEAL